MIRAIFCMLREGLHFAAYLEVSKVLDVAQLPDASATVEQLLAHSRSRDSPLGSQL